MKNHTHLCLLTLISFLSINCFGQISFSESPLPHTTNAPSLMGGGVAFLDYDNDGDEDFYLTSGLSRDHLYENDGFGNFTEVGISAGLAFTADFNTFGVISGDIDNDGDRDIFLTTTMITDSLGLDVLQPAVLLLNDLGTFSNISISAGITDSSISTSATFIDVNNDGYLDIYVSNYVEEEDPLLDSLGNLIGYNSTCFPNYLYINNGNLTFTESANSYGVAQAGCGLAVAATDYDNNGFPDLYIANDFGYWLTPNTLLENQFPTASFSDVSTATGTDIQMFGMGIAIGDYDEDLDLDYYITNIGPNALLNNNGTTSFLDVASSSGTLNDSVGGFLTTGWSTFFFDANNNSYLDLFVANGHIPMPPYFYTTSLFDPNKLYKNNGSGIFNDVSVAAGVADSNFTHGAAYADVNKDGLLDFVISNSDSLVTGNHNSKLYVNSSSGGNWLKLNLQGTVSNRDGFGAHIITHAAGRAFLREVGGGSGHGSQNSSIVHFGLGTIPSIDSITVFWPSGIIDVIHPATVNQTINITEGLGTGIAEINQPNWSVYPNPTKGEVQITNRNFIGEDAILSLLSTTGKLLMEIKLSEPSTSLDLSTFTKGLYLVKISSTNYNYTLSLIIV